MSHFISIIHQVIKFIVEPEDSTHTLIQCAIHSASPSHYEN